MSKRCLADGVPVLSARARQLRALAAPCLSVTDAQDRRYRVAAREIDTALVVLRDAGRWRWHALGRIVRWEAVGPDCPSCAATRARRSGMSEAVRAVPIVCTHTRPGPIPLADWTRAQARRIERAPEDLLRGAGTGAAESREERLTVLALRDLRPEELAQVEAAMAGAFEAALEVGRWIGT